MKQHVEEEPILDAAKEYLTVQKDLILLKTVDKVSYALASSVSICIIVIFILLTLCFVSMAVAFLIAEKTGSFFYGFSMVSGFYFLLTILFIFIRKHTLEIPLVNMLIKQFLKERNATAYEIKN